MKLPVALFTPLSILACVGGLADIAEAGVADPFAFEQSRVAPPMVVGMNALSFLDEIATRDKSQFRMHTDVPDLPDRGMDTPDGIGFDATPIWNTDHLPAGKTVWHYFGADLGRTGGLTLELFGPIGFGGSDSKPGRVHTDIPDLPDLIGPNTSADPIRKPGWGDFSDSAGPSPRPQLESATIPTPSALVLLGVAGCAASRRRRR